MIDVIIFGTGSSAERAWQAMRNLAEVRVAAFSDNNPERLRLPFHNLPAIAPGELSQHRWDFVLVASQWADEIAAQLRGLGVAESRLILSKDGEVNEAMQQISAATQVGAEVRVAGGRLIARDRLPRVLILTGETLNETHGTGVLLKRYFRDFPAARLFSLCHTESGKPWLENSAVLSGRQLTGEVVGGLLRRRSFVPDLVYATALNENDLPLVAASIAALPSGIPVVQHFMDYMPHAATAFDARFREMLPRISEVWALTGSLRTMLREKFGRPVELVTSLQQAVPAEWRQAHRPYAPGFRTVLLGNLWQPWLVPLLRDVWSLARAELPGLQPVEWYVHPQRVQAVLDAGYDPGFEIVWRGFVTGSALQERLRGADLALVPFNREGRAANDYARYSLPSRLTELACAGLPLLAVASADTEPARFLAQHGIGRTVAGPAPEPIAAALVEFIRDVEARRRAGVASRALAEREFRLEPFQEWLIGRFLDLVGGDHEAR
jgi:hypothetical protein